MENFDHRSILVDSGSIVHSCKLTKRSQVRGNARLLACRARSAALVLRARREDCLRLVRRQQRGWLIVEMFWQKKKHMSAGVSSAQWWGGRSCPAVSHHRHVTQVKARHNVKCLGLSCETTTFWKKSQPREVLEQIIFNDLVMKYFFYKELLPWPTKSAG